MNCTMCESPNVFVKDTRSVNGTQRRKRVCNECGHKFTTYEYTDVEIKRLKAMAKPRRVDELRRLKILVDKLIDAEGGGS